MNLFNMNIIKHPDLDAHDAWVILDRDAPQVPLDIRSKLPVPCILTGDTEQAARTLKLLRAVVITEGEPTSSKRQRVAARV